MANQTTIAGASTGNFVKLDHQILTTYANEVLFQAAPLLRFDSIVTRHDELMTTPGNSITVLKYNSLTGKSDIAETATIEAQAMAASTIQVTVTEHAKAIEVSELLLRQSQDNTMERAAQLLGRHYASDLDRVIRDALYSGSNVLWAKSRANRAALTATDYFDMALIKDGVEFLAVNKAPKFNGDSYVCFVHPRQSRRLRDDSGWLHVSAYAKPENMLSGEIGRIDDVRFVETSAVNYIPIGTQNIYSDGADSGDDTAVAANSNASVYRAVMVGDYSVSLATGLPVELRDNGVMDYGRKHGIAYYGIWGAGLLETGHSVILESGAA